MEGQREVEKERAVKRYAESFTAMSLTPNRERVSPRGLS
jgi:hypothetical protein